VYVNEGLVNVTEHRDDLIWKKHNK
jgi:hypothetical protein